MATAKLVRARRNADTARRIKNNWKKQFFEMRDQRDALKQDAARFEWLEANGYLTELDMDSQTIDEQMQIDAAFDKA